MLVSKEKYYNYKELKLLIISQNITTKDSYILKYKQLNVYGKKAPINPITFYGKDICVGWSELLNKPIYKKNKHNLYHTYNECKKQIMLKDIKSKSDYYKQINKIMLEDVGIPYNPVTIYKTEWEGWGIFLGTNRISDNKKKYRPFNESRDWSRNLNLKMSKEWKYLDKSIIPDDIPKKPERTYKNEGWVDYYDWLGIDKRNKISYGEKIIYDYLTEKKIKFNYNKSLLGCKNESKLRFDFYLSEKNICIEFDGIQHYQPVTIFGGEEEFKKTKLRDNIKNDFCELKKINLIRLSYLLSRDEIIDILKTI
jgi:hypothetical protein